ncbi:MAG TPA: aminotransferase class V-fold PLP-dependent enzyme [Solirubrobacteraceae bacterium]
MSISALREQFPVLEHLAYLNAGTDGPLPAAASVAARAEIERQERDGRAAAHFERRHELSASLRSSYAALLGCDESLLALTTCTTEGMSLVVGGLRFTAGEEILTSDEEHPGLLGALIAARELTGVSIRTAPLAQLADAVSPKTRLVACSHVGWKSGCLAPALADLDVPVLLDGAQGLGAVPVDVAALGCDAYAAPGQKWLCGPDGSGVLYVSESMLERLEVGRRGYQNLADPNAGLGATLQPDARRLDALALSAETLACSLAALSVLADAGWQEVHSRALSLARRLAEMLDEHGREVAPRAESTLVSFGSENPPAERACLAEQGIVLRDIPGTPWLRASVGAWNDESDLERLLGSLDR